MLLGYAREGRLISFDPDIDFHYWRDDQDRLEQSLGALEQAGFRQRPGRVDNDGRRVKYLVRYMGVKYEFFEAERVEDTIRWYCFRRRPPRQFLNQIPAHGFNEFDFYDRTWIKPDDHEGYLTALYGDWRTPCPDYKYYLDSKAIVRCDIWSGRDKW